MTIAHLLVSDLHVAIVQRIDRFPAASPMSEDWGMSIERDFYLLLASLLDGGTGALIEIATPIVELHPLAECLKRYGL